VDAGARAFVDEERRAWAPFDALDRLSDRDLDVPVGGAHEWSGRDLIGHLVAWLGDALDAADELRAGDRSEARLRSQRSFATRGDEINAEIQDTWQSLPIEEVRRRLREVPEALRRSILGIPEARWATNAGDRDFFRVYTIGHYDEHVADLEAILDAARRDKPAS
jgi:hypothetical protein